MAENWNSANGFVFHGNAGEIASNDVEEQELAVLSLHLLQASMVHVNTLMIQRVLAEGDWFEQLTKDDLRGVTPLIYQHVNPYGLFRLNMHERLPIDPHEAAA